MREATIIRPLWLAMIFALTGGFFLDLASPSVGFWPAAWAGVALILLSVWGRRPSTGIGLGLLSGAALWMPHISWLTLYLGPIPWAALSTVMILWMGLAGGAIAAITRWFPTAQTQWMQRAPWLRPFLLAASVAGVWVIRELLQSSWPYGGFAWGRVALTQASSPYASLASWLGFAGLSGLMVLLIALLISVRTQRIVVAVVAALTLLLMLVPTYALPKTGMTRVGAVQGNSDAGIFADRQPGDILADHMRASKTLIGEDVDFFVWPENATDIDPTRDPAVAADLDSITERVGAPLVTGVITTRNGAYFNSSLVWMPGEGVVDQYDKRKPVPFAEYMPNRAFFRALVPELVDLVRLDYTAGDASSVVSVANVTAGVAICFDIIFDDLAVDMIDQGAEIVLAQTNNADFGRTDESAQQLAISRLRAIEMGRVVVVISTVGTSAVIAPDGRNLAALEPFTEDSMVVDANLYNGVTPAIAVGWLYAAVFILFGAVGLLTAITARAARSARFLRATRRRDVLPGDQTEGSAQDQLDL